MLVRAIRLSNERLKTWFLQCCVRKSSKDRIAESHTQDVNQSIQSNKYCMECLSDYLCIPLLYGTIENLVKVNEQANNVYDATSVL